MSRLYEELRRRKVFRVATVYLVATWLLLQVSDLLVPVLSLPEWSTRLVLLLLAIGFIPALIIAWAYELAPGGLRRESDADESTAASPAMLSPVLIVSLVATFLALVGGGGYWYLNADERWARGEAFPMIEELADAGRWEDAYAVAREVERRLPENQELADIWQTIGFVTTLESAPSGAEVYRRSYNPSDEEWQHLGRTPISDIKIPFGFSVIRLELENRPHIERVIGGETAGLFRLPVRDVPFTDSAAITPGAFSFDTVETMPEGMVRVPGYDLSIDGESLFVDDFYIGRYEVTNRDYKVFVDNDGYSNPRYWEHEFVENGEIIGRNTAMARFVDDSGRPGPRFWIGGSYPDDQGDFPVTGVSWYEAAAYAAYMARELPSLHHWRRAHAAGMIEQQLSTSNLASGQVEQVGTHLGMGWTGTYGMIGNVREWCFNEIEGLRTIVGGSFADPAYYSHQSIGDPGAATPFDRSVENGFRLAETHNTRQVAARLNAPIEFRSEPEIDEPVPDAVFQAYLSSFDYEQLPLESVIEERVESRHWTRYRVSITSHREGERIALYLYLPNTPATSYQAVIYWPTINALVTDSIDQQFVHLDFVLRNGRAVMFPVVDGVMERRRSSFPNWASIAGRDLVIEAIKDMRRSIDYLESRADIDDDAIAFYGYSWGGRLGAIALAVEPDRLKVGILNQAGLQHLAIPETSVLNYLPRVSAPVLQFNGRYDTDFRFESSAKPFFDLIGTSPHLKKHVVNDTSHYVPREIVIGETLDWLDEHLGPVN